MCLGRSDSIGNKLTVDPYIWQPSRAVRPVGFEYQCLEDSRNGLPPMPVGGNKVRGGVRATDDRSGDFILVDTTCPGTGDSSIEA